MKLKIIDTQSDDNHWDAIESLVASIPADILYTFASLDAKLADMLLRARKAGGIMLLNVLTTHGGVSNGDTFPDVIARLRKHHVSTEDVQTIVDDAYVWPSLTTHPTNPTSLEYTLAGLALDGVLANANTTTAQLRDAIGNLLRTSMDVPVNENGDRKKTPEMEARELMEILTVLYHSTPGPLASLRDALKANGYGDVKVTRLLCPHVWGPGDGDGNPNMDAAILESVVEMFTRQIAFLYRSDAERLEQNIARECDSHSSPFVLSALNDVRKASSLLRTSSVPLPKNVLPSGHHP